MTAGTGTGRFAKMATISMLDVRRRGQGKEGHKKPVLFPKLVFLYDKNLHGPGCELEDVFEAGIRCSRQTMYPDWLSLTGEGYIASMYKKYGKIISPMGCRAFLSPWCERGGMEPADENDKPVFVGRFNIREPFPLHLPMILAKSRSENRDFHEVLDFYLEMIRDLHKRTYDYLGEMRASTNPLAYCEGGFYGGHLKPSDKIRPLLKPMTASFGITALNELQELYNGKSLVEDGQFALDTLKYINDKVAEFKKEDGILYAIYGTPAESLCGLQIEQFRKQYGIVRKRFGPPVCEQQFPLPRNRGHYPDPETGSRGTFLGALQRWKNPVRALSGRLQQRRDQDTDRACDGAWLLRGRQPVPAYCDDCGHQELDMDVCPVCGSRT